LTEYQGKPLKDVRRGALPTEELGEAVQAEPDKAENHLLKRVKRTLREQVNEVRASARLKQSAACIVLGEHDMSHQMRELLAAAGHDLPVTPPDLELNLSHPLVKRLEREQ